MTTLDPASTQGARALERLSTDKIAWLTTVGPDGQPQSSPIWFLWVDGEVFLYSHKTAPRNRNLAARPTVAFNLNTDPGGDDVVTMEGVARFDPDAPLASAYPDYLAKYHGFLAEYGWEATHMDREYPIAVRITPTRWRVS
ncbi:MAG TPA: TIGR03667 family PPOX class F420-dependent oxidoreductase [Candidatus Saccharimonadales bacterium]|nr:TIGR03667 family PPOX class F420-dependent oxidoreductase [Candidatus Saccharimonadales bacterium]